MSDRIQPSALSEIGHLFLSTVRDAAGNGQMRPQRTPPGKTRVGINEATVPTGESQDKLQEASARGGGGRRVPVTMLLAGHLGSAAGERVTRLASQFCEDGRRIGLVMIDAGELSIRVFDRDCGAEIHGDGSTQDASADAALVTQALDELAWDVDQWLIYSPATRDGRVGGMLSAADEWVLLSTCDHDGIVSSYRTLKGLAELHPPALSLVCVDATDDAEARGAFERIDGVCQQFLEWSLVDHQSLAASARVAGHTILRANWVDASAERFWSAVSRFFAPAAKAAASRRVEALPIMRTAPAPAAVEAPAPRSAPSTDFPNVIDLPANHADASAVVEAVIGAGAELVASPIRPPMCPQASVAIDANTRLTLVAVAKQGLSDLKLIGRAYQWLIENRGLVAMALPTVRIDAHALPRLSLLVDQVDLSADLLQPMMLTGSVTVHAYRKLRWGDRVGMLLEAA